MKPLEVFVVDGFELVPMAKAGVVRLSAPASFDATRSVAFTLQEDEELAFAKKLRGEPTDYGRHVFVVAGFWVAIRVPIDRSGRDAHVIALLPKKVAEALAWALETGGVDDLR